MGNLGGALALLMFVGAARKDASPEQVARLKAEALPPLSDKSLDDADAYRTCLETVVEIMGPDWTPGPEWQAQIDTFLNPGVAQGN